MSASSNRAGRGPGRWLATALLVCLAVFSGRIATASCTGSTSVAAVTGRDGTPVPEGRHVDVTGVVSGVFAGSDGLDGFFLQQQRHGVAPAGVFVYTPGRAEDALPVTGTRVVVEGRTGRYHDRPQLEWVTAITRCGSRSARATPLSLPASPERLEALVNTRVRVSQELTVSGVADLARWGSLRLSAGGRRFHPGTGIDGGPAAGVVLDDGSYERRPRPVPYLDETATRRAGSRVSPFEAVLVRSFGEWRLHPVSAPVFENANPRRKPPPADDALRLATFNIENFFPVSAARGPRTTAARMRQRRALEAAVRTLAADVLVIQELENRSRSCGVLRDLLASSGAGDYRCVIGDERVGDDAIRCAILYRPARVILLGSARSSAPVHNRPPLLARFRLPRGRRLDVVAVHFKSKAGCTSVAATSCGEDRRVGQARSLTRWLATDDDVPTFVLGDFNSYENERPIRELTGDGLIDLVAREVPARNRYTYIYRGQSGRLDYVLADREAAVWPARVAIWHVGADEPAAVVDSGPWGASDHDAVLVDLALQDGSPTD